MKKAKPSRGILPSDIDTAGNVTVWDHGPSEIKQGPHENDDAFKVRSAAADVDAEAWHKKHGDGPVPLVMHSSDAGHSIAIEPQRYALEPHDLSDDEIAERIKEIQDNRAAAKQAQQDMIDRKEAVASLMSERAAAVAKSDAEELV